MSHVIHVSEESYRILESLARVRGQTAEAFLETWIAEQAKTHSGPERDPHQNPRYETFDEFFHGLGMSEDDIQRAKQTANSDDANI